MLKNKKIKVILTYLYVIVFFIFLLLPIFFMITTSIKMPVDTFSVPPKILNFKPTLINYYNLYKRLNLGHIFRNSIYLSLSSTVLVTSIALLSALSLARFNYKGKNIIAFFILTMRMAPAIAVVIPTYFFFERMGLLNNLNGLVLLYTAFSLPFAIWLIRSFVNTVPVEIEESGMIDGLSKVAAFFRLTTRLCLGGIIATIVLTFMDTWNEFLFALVLTNVDSRTLPVAVTAFFGDRGVDWGQMAALGTIISFPVFILSLLIRKHLVAGLTFGAIKE